MDSQVCILHAPLPRPSVWRHQHLLRHHHLLRPFHCGIQMGSSTLVFPSLVLELWPLHFALRFCVIVGGKERATSRFDGCFAVSCVTSINCRELEISIFLLCLRCSRLVVSSPVVHGSALAACFMKLPGSIIFCLFFAVSVASLLELTLCEQYRCQLDQCNFPLCASGRVFTNESCIFVSTGIVLGTRFSSMLLMECINGKSFNCSAGAVQVGFDSFFGCLFFFFSFFYPFQAFSPIPNAETTPVLLATTTIIRAETGLLGKSTRRFMRGVSPELLRYAQPPCKLRFLLPRRHRRRLGRSIRFKKPPFSTLEFRFCQFWRLLSPWWSLFGVADDDSEKPPTSKCDLIE